MDVIKGLRLLLYFLLLIILDQIFDRELCVMYLTACCGLSFRNSIKSLNILFCKYKETFSEVNIILGQYLL